MTPLDPLQIGTSFLHDNLDLKDLIIEHARMDPNSTLFLHFQTLEDRLRALRAKRRLTFLPPTQSIFLDVGLTKTQLAKLKQSRDRVTAMRKEGKWAIIEISETSSEIQHLQDTITLEPNDNLVQMGNMLGGVGSPSPLVVGTVMVHFSLHQVDFVMWSSLVTSFSSQRHTSPKRTTPLIHRYHCAWSCQ